MEKFRGGTVQWLCYTDAAGMGCDMPDILLSIEQMLWLVEEWAFKDSQEATNEERDEDASKDEEGKK
ncbi:hypothetical protein LXA43DRAFT_1096446 [Ganoderma leucocontextum]|nr:hypothetical protein LXA43DRAFT_1096446 [Ganoderma leucocontextum]